MQLTIQPWSQVHTAWLRPAIREFLKAGEARGGDLLATERNVDTYLKIGMQGALKGDPCLLALVDYQPVAYVLWVGAPDVVDSKYKTINAIGSYTEPAHRSKFIAAALRDRALAMSRERGYTRVYGPVHNTNERGIKEFCVAYQAWPVSTNFELLL